MTGDNIVARNLSKDFRRSSGEVVKALDDLSLEVARGEILVLLGPSGCGKTTLLRCLAGLEHPDSGEVLLGGTPVFSSERRVNLAPEHRNAAMLFQSYALWPHMTVFDNVAYPLRVGESRRARLSRKEISDRVMQMLETVQCAHIAKQHPGQISGGQQQRVALARALVRQPQVIFFDEPLSNVDAQLRDGLRVELRLLQQQLHFSAVYVTHDQEEALAVGDRIAVLREGKIAQHGTPMQIHDEPASPYVARFMGPVNESTGMVVESAQAGPEVATIFGNVHVPASVQSAHPGERLAVLSRPASSRVCRQEPSEGLRARMVVETQLFRGTYMETVLAHDNGRHIVWTPAAEPLSLGQQVWVTVREQALLMFRDDAAQAQRATPSSEAAQ